MRILWRYGTIGLGIVVALFVGSGNVEKGIGAGFVVVFASVFLNWSMFGGTTAMRRLGLIALALLGGISGWAYSSSADLTIPVRILAALFGSAMLGGARLAIDRYVRPQYKLDPPPFTAAVWTVDPFGRHELRYWDGIAWTPHVIDRGVRGVDPPKWQTES